MTLSRVDVAGGIRSLRGRGRLEPLGAWPVAGGSLGPLAAALLLLCLTACSDEVTAARSIPDDFCHGELDGVRCDDGNACTEADVCGNGVCLGRSVPDNVVCDDGLVCTTLDYCEAGVCKGRDVDCSDTATGVCEVGACDPASGECVAVAAPGGTCDDGNACTDADQCGASGCAGVPRDCADTAVGACEAAVCDPATGGCAVVPGPDGARCGDPADLCVVSTCKAGACVAAPKCAAEAQGCQLGICEATTGACTFKPKTDGTSCEDGNPCVAGEACLAGQCLGGTVEPDGTLCQDGDPCHTVGLCDAGSCHAPAKDCSSAGGVCTVGTCDPATGDCFAQPRADGAACDDGQSCTTGETCAAGLCVAAASACSCTGKPDGTPCDDADLCTSGDACAAGVCLGALKDCSAKDGPCTAGDCSEGVCVAVPAVDGTPCDDGDACTTGDGCVGGGCDGAPVVCEAGPCMISACNPSTGGCSTAPAPTGAFCDDGNPCTDGDRCADGSCGGGFERCVACAGKVAGAPCDDSSACTADERCVADGNALVCAGPQTTCVSGAPCHVATCDPANGACLETLAAEGVGCDDGDSCTVSDACDAVGGCAGTPVDFCGAQVAGCAPDLPATPPWTGLVWLEPGVPTELPLMLGLGQALSVSTAAHCGAAVDTLVELVDPEGVIVAQADDTGSPFAALSGAFISKAGQHTLRVLGAFLNERASVLLTVATTPAVACASDAACQCSDKQCTSAPGSKVCTYKVPAAPVGSLAGLAPGQSVRGHLFAGVETFAASVDLPKGQPITVVTRGLCGALVDTRITIRGPDGVVIAQADGGGQGPFAVAEAAIAKVAGLHVIEVDSPTADSGAFVLEVRSGLCTKTADCVCAERACSGQPGQPGVCAPKLDVPEPEGLLLPTLTVGNRIHSDLSSTEDVDEYAVQLPVGSYNVRVRGFCGGTTAASADVLPVAGPVILAAGSPDVLGLVVSEAGPFRVAVGGGVGDYTLLVEVAP